MKQKKQQAIDLLRQHTPQQADLLHEIDPRLLEYYEDLCQNSSTDDDDPNDWHNLYELLAALKLLRLMRTYPVDIDKVHQVIRLREGVWHQEGGIWKHTSGGLKQPGRNGDKYYRWLPFQVFVLTAMYGPMAWVDTEVANGTRELLPSEREGANGTIEDLRRLCTDFTLFAPRKVDKTGLSAYNNFLYFMLEDDDSEIYCCANSQTQSRLLFKRTADMIHQMDPNQSRIRFTSSEVNWKPGQIRKAQLCALSAGGKAKDGLFAQLCCADEFGSASYVRGRSDMGALVNVVLSSMGPRRTPMMFTSTSAGTISEGPFIDKLENMKGELLSELTADADAHTDKPDGRLQAASDRWMILPLCPDEWQQDESVLFTSKAVRRKVNPALGVMVQNSFYEQSVADSMLDPMKKKETISKLFNVYQTGRITKWITGDRIRPLQVNKRITDCTYANGWQVFAGYDFSQGSDLFALTYLGVNYTPGTSMRGRFFADMKAWVLEKELKESPNRPLYERWIADGWLQVCPGEVFDSSYAINDIAAVVEQGINIHSIGYDPAQSAQPINQLKAWLQTLFISKVRQQGAEPDMAQIAKIIDQMVIPVSQTALTQNPRIAELEHMILEKEPWIEFSANPLWTWQFGNTAAEEHHDLRRLCKGGTINGKMDNVAALIDALYCFDISESKI